MGVLVGKKQIAGYCKRSWHTIRVRIMERDFPARKIDGEWESDEDLIDQWRRNEIQDPPGDG